MEIRQHVCARIPTFELPGPLCEPARGLIAASHDYTDGKHSQEQGTHHRLDLHLRIQPFLLANQLRSKHPDFFDFIRTRRRAAGAQ